MGKITHTANWTPKTNDLWIWDHKSTLDFEGKNGHSDLYQFMFEIIFFAVLYTKNVLILHPLAFTFISIIFALMEHAVRNLHATFLLMCRKITS